MVTMVLSVICWTETHHRNSGKEPIGFYRIKGRNNSTIKSDTFLCDVVDCSSEELKRFLGAKMSTSLQCQRKPGA